MKEIILSRELITPQRAKALLENNTMNRKLQIGWAMKIAHKMEKGTWDENNSATIGISVNGTLIDGQHRLKALIIANKSYMFNIAYNLPTSSYKITDIHKSRGAANIFEAAGEKNANILASIVPGTDKIIRYGKMVVLRGLFSKTSERAKIYYSQELIFDLFSANDDFYRKNAKVVTKLESVQGRVKILTPSTIGIFYGYVSLYYPSADVEKYLIDILKGENISASSVEYQIRKKILEIKTDPFQKIDIETAYNMLAHGWNLKLEGKSWSRNKYNGEKVKLIGIENKVIDYKIVEL